MNKINTTQEIKWWEAPEEGESVKKVVSRKIIEQQLAATIKGWDDLTKSKQISWRCHATIAIAETGHFQIAADKNIYGVPCSIYGILCYREQQDYEITRD